MVRIITLNVWCFNHQSCFEVVVEAKARAKYNYIKKMHSIYNSHINKTEDGLHF